MKIFFGKISQEFGEQNEENFYAGEGKNGTSYNGLEIEDFVLIYNNYGSK